MRLWRTGLLLALVAAWLAFAEPAAATFPQQSGLVDLLTQANLRIDGAMVNDTSGWSVAEAGDVNGDGLDDVIVGAPHANNNGRTDSGSAYVVCHAHLRGVVELGDSCYVNCRSWTSPSTHFAAWDGTRVAVSAYPSGEPIGSENYSSLLHAGNSGVISARWQERHEGSWGTAAIGEVEPA